jgi:DDE superfamily endonuclease
MGDIGCRCKITVDGTDCPIQEPTPFNPGWYSHKFKGPGVRYEVGVCIRTGWIVWVNGPFPCGRWPDINIFRNNLVFKLGLGEMVLADGGYRDGRVFCDTPNGFNTPEQYVKSVARARHETVNGRFKRFEVLNAPYRHDLRTHGWCFRAIANITQIKIQTVEPVFQVLYDV